MMASGLEVSKFSLPMRKRKSKKDTVTDKANPTRERGKEH